MPMTPFLVLMFAMMQSPFRGIVNRQLSTDRRNLESTDRTKNMRRRDPGNRPLPFKSGLNLCAEDAQEFGEPGMKRGPGRAGDQIAVDESFGHGETDVCAAGQSNVRAGGGIGAALLPGEDASGGENLRRVADGRKRLVRFRKTVNDLDDPRVEPEVFHRAAAGDH